ncbi:MAG: hypothetical protein WBE76_13335 [Terracidiphilus sp.]
MRGTMRLCALTFPLLAALLAPIGHAAPKAANPRDGIDGGSKQAESTERYQMLWDKGFDLPPGSHLRFAKVDETAGLNGRSLRYRIYADAAQQAVPYVLGVWRIGTSIDDLQVLSEAAYVNHKGLVLGTPPNPAQQEADALNDGSELDVSVTVAQGEPVRLVLRTEDSKTMIGGTLVPFPIQSTDKSCKLSALLADPEANALLIYADGFPRNSILTVQNVSQGVVQEQKLYTDARGQGSVIVLPHLRGADSGTATETIQAGGCKVSVSVPWGRGSYHPM